MEITNVIVRKPVSAEQRTKGLAMLLQIYPKIGRIEELGQKLDTNTITVSEMAECLSIIMKADICAKFLGFADHMSMCQFITIFGSETL